MFNLINYARIAHIMKSNVINYANMTVLIFKTSITVYVIHTCPQEVVWLHKSFQEVVWLHKSFPFHRFLGELLKEK